jgi:sec-independent protein translocase protein TatA
MFEGILQPQHLLIILVAALFLFGPSKLPELGKGLADGIRNFKKAVNEPSEPEKPQCPPVDNPPAA